MASLIFSGESFLLSCKVKPIDCRDHLGFVIKSDQDLSKCLLLTLEPTETTDFASQISHAGRPFLGGIRRIHGASCPARSRRTASRGESLRVHDGAPIDIKILIDHDLVEAFVDEKVALTYRCYDAAEYKIGIIVQDGNAEYEEISFKK